MDKESCVTRVKSDYRTLGQRAGAALSAPSREQIQVGLFILGLVLLTAGLVGGASAAFDDGSGLMIDYNDQRLAQSVNAVLTYIEGTFGALIMTAAGLGAILSSAFGQYRAALGCLVVAIGAFILRSILGTFFNDIAIQR